MESFKNIALALFTKKRLIGWGSAVVLALGAGYASMDPKEFKEAVCGAPTIAASGPEQGK